MLRNKNILVTGSQGYLAPALCNVLSKNNTIQPYEIDVRHSPKNVKCDCIIHFACPSDREDFKDANKTASTIIEGTLNMIQLSRLNRCKIIFASTMGVYNPDPDDIYCTCKLAMENYIKSCYNNYVILRIPRVYSDCRKKGLMKQLRDNNVPDEDMHHQIEYMTLQDFVDQTLPVLEKVNVTHEYNVTNVSTIGEIKRWVEA